MRVRRCLPAFALLFLSVGSAFAFAQNAAQEESPELHANLSRPGCTPAVGAESYNAACFGADPTGMRDSSPAINAAIRAAHGVRVRIPAGHYLLKSPIVLGDNQVTPRLDGDGVGVTVLAPCFRGDSKSPSHQSVITVDGTLVNGEPQPYHFANGGFLRSLTINGMDAAARNPSAGCPTRIGGRFGPAENNLNGIQITGWKAGEIEDVEVEFMQLDGINSPWRSDLWDACSKAGSGQGPDCFQVANFELKHSTLMYNNGWGFRAETGNGFTYSGLIENRIHINAAGGVYIYGWQFFIVNNDISSNGCSVGSSPPNGECIKTQPVGTLSPQPGGGILLVRAAPEPTSPRSMYSTLLARIERNELDSNYAYDIWIQAGDEVQVISNRFINHGIMWRTGAGGNYPHCQVVVGYGNPSLGYIVRNPLFRDNLTRSDSPTKGPDDFETQMYCVDAGHTMQAIEEQDGTFGPNTFNFSVLAAGGGAAATCTQSGGKLAGCSMQSGGWYPPNQAPNVRIDGPGCRGQSVRPIMKQAGQNGWSWVDSLQVERAGDGCQGQVWPVFEPVPFPRTNRLGNSFIGFNPPGAGNPKGIINYSFTTPASQ